MLPRPDGHSALPELRQIPLPIEPDLGLLLPCNVVVRTDDSGQTLVSSLNQGIMMSVPGRPELEPIAADAKTRLQAALAAVANPAAD